MTLPTLSVIVVSRGRPAGVTLCLASLAQSDHPTLEVVVVACPSGVAAVRAGGWGGRVRILAFDTPNIAAARNLGLRHAAGDVVAFIDDDAVAEPTWATRLCAPFADPRVTAAGGFVRGRNGLSWQWRGMEVDALGRDHPFAVTQTTLRTGSATRAVKTQGTNCAFRRTTLCDAGGFDEALHFYLDEADVNLRLASLGGVTAVVPGAEVIHGFAASPRRRADRVPRDLSDIGASTAVFLRRHAHPGQRAGALADLLTAQRRRLLAHMVAGRLGPEEVGPLLRTLHAGIAAGQARDLPPLIPLGPPQVPFHPLADTGRRDGCVILSAPRTRATAEDAARAARRAGQIVTLLHLTPGPRRHRAWLRPDGIWEQAGGRWGRSDRTRIIAPWDALARTDARLRHETLRIGAARPVGQVP